MIGSKTRELVLMAIFTSILFVSQVALGFLPNIEVVSLLIILYTIHLRKKVFFIIYDIPHCIGNVIVCLLLFKPLDKIIGKAVYSEEYNNE